MDYFTVMLINICVESYGLSNYQVSNYQRSPVYLTTMADCEMERHGKVRILKFLKRERPTLRQTVLIARNAFKFSWKKECFYSANGLLPHYTIVYVTIETALGYYKQNILFHH